MKRMGISRLAVRWRSLVQVWRSIRTQYALATVVFVLLALSVFYIGGRIVLVHLAREAEREMKRLDLDVDSAVRASAKTRPARVGTDAVRPSRPLVSEAISFYSGGFWDFGDGPLEATYAVRDAAGRLVSTETVRIPNNLSGLMRVALSRLGFFVAFAGILLLLFLFFLQSRLLLDPLTRMTNLLSEIGTRGDVANCPRLEWKGRDEFARLALSVNRMLETISRRSQAVAQAEARHRELISILPVSLLVFDSEARFVSVLKEGGMDLPPGLYLGERPAEGVYGVETVERFTKMLVQTIRTGKAGVLRVNIQRPIGARRSQLTRHYELRIARFDEYFALVMVSDITEEVDEHNRLRLAEARVNDSEKRESLTLLAASVAHDMNNVLSVVLNAAEAESADPSGDSADTLRTIREAVRRGTGMMRELREFAGDNRMSFHRMRVAVLVEDVRVLTEGMSLRNILFSYAVDSDVPDVDADPNQFWKVIFNIVKNAGEAIGESRPGRIGICCRRMDMTAEDATKFISGKPLAPGVGAVFVIQDDGPGIPAGLLTRLFDPYVSSKAVGRGLGLATVRTIVEAHGGGIRVTSREGLGTRFEIYLPESRQEAQEDPGRTEAAGGRHGREVLVVDDDASILRTAAILLKTMDFVPHVAKDQAEAMAVIRRNAPNLRAVILDADLGGTDSVRLLGVFRESVPCVPVIVSSGSAEAYIRRLFAPHPYDVFLAKPYTVTELKAALD